LAMTARQRDFLHDAFPEHRRKIVLLSERAGQAGDVNDPIGKSWPEYQACRKTISAALDRLLAAS
ncbi:MAG: low molecular weight protein arginine phosphatase, partial [Elusimicrobia bacterium]|nr:low molecular weight protein arginine phosphatase [Elusimicrobiota bacterium]